MKRSLPTLSASIFALVVGATSQSRAGIVDDSNVRVANVDETRSRLIQYIFGPPGMPMTTTSGVVPRPNSVATSLLGVTINSLQSVTELDFDLGQGVRTAVYDFRPTQPNGRLMIVHVGHNAPDEARGPETVTKP